ncbi:MAG: 4-hydroxybenzoate octaprenyltransferase [Hyphomicrobiaceae bacterium]
MTKPSPQPQNTKIEPVADAAANNWVDHWAPTTTKPYLKLARMDRPIGTWLLVFPCWWSLTLSHITAPQLALNYWWTLALFAIGALVMRGAGCAYNDYVDREFDAQVTRTRNRPIPSGQVTPGQALIFVAVLLLIGLVVLLQFNTFTIFLAMASLLLVAVYPFMKRLTYWPQLVLGLVFNWGALVGWSAAQGDLSLAPILLYAGAVCWTMGYDTIYAHQDKEDDLMLGLKSTAIRFGDATLAWVTGFYAAAVVLWSLGAFLAGANLVTFIAIALIALQLSWQVSTLDTNDADNCLIRFRSNREVGAILFLGLLADACLNSIAGAA